MTSSSSSYHKPWKYPAPMTRDDWRVEPRTNVNGHREYWLQHREADRVHQRIYTWTEQVWTDFSGPYRQHGSAMARFHRMELYWLMDMRRDPAHVHTWDSEPGTPLRRCTVCRLYEESIITREQ